MISLPIEGKNKSEIIKKSPNDNNIMTILQKEDMVRKEKYIKEKNLNIEKNINCCPNKILCCFCKYCKNNCSKCCCNCYISYYSFFALSLLMSLSLHIFDVGSDIFVLVDLYSKDIYFFSCCLGIIILSFFASSILSCFGQTQPNIRPGELFNNNVATKKPKCRSFLDLILGFFQLGIFVEAYYSLKIGEKTHTFVWSRVLEGLLESCPQSLFQLFIVLKSADTFTITNIARYYTSIAISLLNLSMVLVTFEIYRYEYERRKGHTPISGIPKITMFSPYGLVLTLYRLTEISSRMGLLGCIGYMYNGYAILISLLLDYILSIVLTFLYIRIKETRRFSCCKAVYLSFSKILFLPSYWKPFTSKLPGNTVTEYYEDIFHWLSKYINNGILSAILITKLINDNNNLSFNIISITSISCFILNVPLLYFVILWNRKHTFVNDFFYIRTCWCPKKQHLNKFKPFVCCKCYDCCGFFKESVTLPANQVTDASSKPEIIIAEEKDKKKIINKKNIYR